MRKLMYDIGESKKDLWDVRFFGDDEKNWKQEWKAFIGSGANRVNVKEDIITHLALKKVAFSKIRKKCSLAISFWLISSLRNCVPWNPGVSPFWENAGKVNMVYKQPLYITNNWWFCFL